MKTIQDLPDSDLLDALRLRIEEKVCAIHDLQVVTRKLEEVNRRLISSEAVKSDFLANIRNEINNPLSTIIGLSREIARARGGSEDCPALGSSIYQEAFSLDFQLRNILTAAEIEAGECTIETARVAVRRLIEDTIDAFRPGAEARGIKIGMTWSGAEMGEEIFRTDPRKLEIITANLISNAVKFSPDGGAVDVTVGISEGWIEIRVRDRGIGIAAAEHEMIFERFRQLDSGRAKSYPGHGLGLTVIRALLDLLRGNIGVESNPGAGSVFTVRIPELDTGDTGAPYSPQGNALVFGEEERF